MKQEYSAIRYFGGKGNMVSEILSRFPDPSTYDIYVEPYGGAGTILLNKPYTAVEIYNDLEKNVYALMHVLSSPLAFAEFRIKCELALYSEAMSVRYKKSLALQSLPLVERAFRFWYVNRVRRSANGGFNSSTTIRRGMSKATSDFLSSVDRLPALHSRLSTMMVRNCDALNLIANYDRERTMIYLDPPYVHSTRTMTRYRQDVDDNHHQKLVRQILSMKKARILLSGYDNPIYGPLEVNGWRRHDFKVETVDGSNTPKEKTECLWSNYDDQTKQLSLFEDVA